MPQPEMTPTETNLLDTCSEQCLFTFAIPTYNGDLFLEQAIDSILSQCSLDKGLFEILVSDNASTDRTALVVKSAQMKRSHSIIYNKHPRNLGYDNNIDWLFNNAKGRYVWLLGDDDYLMPGSINKIKDIVSQNLNLSAIVVGVEFYDTKNECHFPSATNVESDRYYESGDEFFRESSWSCAAMSSIIIRRADWLEFNNQQWVGSQWIHVGGLINVLSQKRLACRPSGSLVVVRIATERWQRNGNHLLLGLKNLAIFSKMESLGYASNTRKAIFDKYFQANPGNILNHPPKSYLDRIRIFLELRKYFSNRLSLWIIHTPLLFLPTFAINFLHWLYFSCNLRRVYRALFPKGGTE